MKIEVFTYEITRLDFAVVERITKRSDLKVTREYLAELHERTKDTQEKPGHRLLEDTRELVEPALMDPEGRYHPEWKQ